MKVFDFHTLGFDPKLNISVDLGWRPNRDITA